jgi:hypothetical protein
VSVVIVVIIFTAFIPGVLLSARFTKGLYSYTVNISAGLIYCGIYVTDGISA